ncbi:MAG: CstA-like transporter-associated (seleno)protein [Methylococcales bacterium]|nr:CstA-like transporter-associated (seleno)protein [Methylococcales bacterium]MDD5633440.1 CstA-like transporter-associated (seleno)protein [Methylococcales bacterium]
MLDKLKAFWRIIRRLSGDDAYEQYLKHYARYHQADEGHECHQPLTKADFFKQWQNEKWNGIKRCC